MVRQSGMVAAVLFTILSTTAQAEPWARTYVIEWYEAANYYGGKGGILEPGSDCPQGAMQSPDWVKLLVDAGYTEKEAKWLRDPANPTREPNNGQPMMAFRGTNRQNVYDYPTTSREYGITPVAGTIGLGFNLDGDTKTGFVSPTGEKGIDHAHYKALGCLKGMRGPARLSERSKGANDSMREGAWTVLIVVSGEGKDPANDPKVRVGLYLSRDKIVRDGSGGVAKDYTFTIQPDQKRQAMFEGSTRKGVITAKAPSTIWMRGPDTSELKLAEAQLRFEMKPDGSLSGMLGGYRPWRPIYEALVNARGPVAEPLGWVRLPDVYYALQRYADYSPTGPGGEKTHISYNMRVDALPAFVMTPDATTPIKQVQLFAPEPGGTRTSQGS
jgi:hypothetical protein